MTDPHSSRNGLLYGFTAYALWGMLPLYFIQLKFAPPLEIVAERVVWTFAVCLLSLAAMRRLRDIRAVFGEPRQLGYLALAAGLISANWLIFVYAATHGEVLQASLGYFINPLITVLLGVVILRERLRRAQWIAVALALVAVACIGVAYGHPPWIALLLAFSFGLYGLTKKFAGRRTGAVQSLAVETLLLTPIALGVLIWLSHKGESHFTSQGAVSMLLLSATGLVTAVPLTNFAAAARRLPLSTLGMLQYIAPILQFIIAVAVMHEPMSPLRWDGFVLIWAALGVFSADALLASFRERRCARRQAAQDAMAALS